MVLVSVGDKDAADFLFILHYIGKVRDDDVDAQHRFVRERQTAVDDEHIVPTLIDGHVLSDFIKSSQWDNADQRLFSVLFAASLGAWAGIFRFCCIWCCFLCRLVFCRLCLLLAARIVASAAPCSFFSAGLCFLFPTGRLFDQLDCALNRLAERIDFLVLPWLAVIVSWFTGIRLWTGVFFIHVHFLLVVCGPATQSGSFPLCGFILRAGPPVVLSGKSCVICRFASHFRSCSIRLVKPQSSAFFKVRSNFLCGLWIKYIKIYKRNCAPVA